jgi:glycosyltransferase involved in cell wall biosynthesis
MGATAEKPLISVVIQTFNEEKYVRRALSRLQKQTIPRDRYEIIVVDGHSKDRTVE